MRRNALLRIIPMLLALWLSYAPSGFAAALYEHSLEKFAARVKQVDPEDYTFVVLGDSRGNDQVFRKSLALAATFRPLLVLHGGDMTETGTREELERFLAIVREKLPDTPLFAVVGNHERDKRLFQELIGPLNFTVDSSRLNVEVIAVDNSASTLKQPALDYLRLQLREKRRTAFITMHVPPKTANWDWHTFSEGLPDFLRLIGEKKPDMLFFSHVHQYARAEVAGVPAVITGGAGAPLYQRDKFPGEPVYHIVVVRVKHGKVSEEMVRVRN